MSAARIDFDGPYTYLRERGLLLETDRAFPSLVAMMAGGPVKGTWWAHPLANEIYQVGMRLMKQSDVIYVRLVAGKMTYVHRRLWPALYSVATAREPWQLANLPESAKSMLKMLDKRESLRMDEIKSARTAKKLGTDARLLESRLLAFGDDVHTDSGAHVKRVETWPHWAKRVGFETNELPASDEARRELERVVAQLNLEHSADATLPWQTRERPVRRTRARSA